MIASPDGAICAVCLCIRIISAYSKRAPSFKAERVFVVHKEVVKIEKINDRNGSGAVKMPLIRQERKLIEILRNLDYGEVRVVVKDSEIVQIEEKKSIKL